MPWQGDSNENPQEKFYCKINKNCLPKTPFIWDLHYVVTILSETILQPLQVSDQEKPRTDYLQLYLDDITNTVF